MEYKTIRELMRQEMTDSASKMNRCDYDGFSVIVGKNIKSTIVDATIAPYAVKMKWCDDGAGYPVTRFFDRNIRLHDFVMAMHGLDKPEGAYVDHINLDKHDNRLNNLRFVDPQTSAKNMPLRSNNTTGITGVSKTKKGKFRAYITLNGKQYSLGAYETIREAAEARKEAEKNLGFEVKTQTIKELCELIESKAQHEN